MLSQPRRLRALARIRQASLAGACVLAVLAGGQGALAQDCSAVPEAIVKLRTYNAGNYSVWDNVYGEEAMEHLNTLEMTDDGSIIVGGEVFARGNPESSRGLLAEIGQRGKVIWENRHEKSADMSIDRLVRIGKGLMTIGTATLPDKGMGIRLGFYDGDGTFRKQKLISDSHYDFHFAAMVPSIEDDGGMAIAMTANDRKNKSDQFGIVMRIGRDGREIWRRSYKPGIANVLNGLAVVYNSVGMPFYMAAGNLEADDRRRTGMLMQLDPGGRLVGVQQYPRGASATFRGVSNLSDGHFVVIGDIEPYGDLFERSAWVMRVDADSGDLIWQRYIALAHYRLFGRDIYGYPDGRMAVLLDAEKQDEPAPKKADDPKGVEEVKGDEVWNDQSRLLTLSPRGTVVRDEPFTEGDGGRGQKLVIGPRQQRIIVGYAEKSHKADDPGNALNYNTDDGWVLMASPLEAYTDPCIPRPRGDE